MNDFTLQEHTNIAWAFSTAAQNDAPLFAALATATQQHTGDFKPQDLANTAWAFATAA